MSRGSPHRHGFPGAIVHAVLFAIALSLAEGAPARAQDALDLLLHAETPLSPWLVPGSDGLHHASYSIFLTNWFDSDLAIQAVDVIDPGSGETLHTISGPELVPGTFRVVGPTASSGPGVIPGGRTAHLRVWIAVESVGRLSGGAVHRFRIAPSNEWRILGDGPGSTLGSEFLLAPVTFDTREPIRLDPPVRGYLWRASGGAGADSYHMYTVPWDGGASTPQRFAMDLTRIDSTGNILPLPLPERLENATFYTHREPVYAVADGVVVGRRDDIPENVPSPTGEISMPVPLTRETAAGNTIALRLADGLYAHYAHLAPGTLRVRVGEPVRRGQFLGCIGNSGNAVNPHLHFQVSSEPELNAGEGRPYVFTRFDLYGHVPRGGGPPDTSSPARLVDRLPMFNAVMRFPVRDARNPCAATTTRVGTRSPRRTGAGPPVPHASPGRP